MVQLADPLPPCPPGRDDEYNAKFREGWEYCAANFKHSTFTQRTSFAHGYAKAKLKREALG